MFYKGETMKIALRLALVIGLIVSTTGCSMYPKLEGKINTKEEMLDYIDGLSCGDLENNFANSQDTSSTTSNPIISCNLKGKYDVIGEEDVQDIYGNTRNIYLRLKDYDYEFVVFSKYTCVQGCEYNFVFSLAYAYTITTEYHKGASNYFIAKYSELNEIACCFDPDSNYSYLINEKDEVAIIAEYINGYIDYLNNLDIKTLEKDAKITMYFTTRTYRNSSYYRLPIYILLLDGQYILVKSKYKSSTIITNLKDYILEYCEENDVF